jgi:probable phosphomutase (TIGR03848 family)
VSTVILLRHGQSTANERGVLAGRSSGVGLSEKGRTQAEALVARMADVPIAELVVSPMLRCKQTISVLRKTRDMSAVIEPRLSEVDYGAWTGRSLRELAKEPLWRVVQTHPSAAVFPEGEGLAAVQARAVAAVREHDARITREHGENAVWLLCSHGDVLKAILADALGQHLDSFQRIVVDPMSISVVRYTETSPFVLRINDHSAQFNDVVPQQGIKGCRNSGDAVPGGTTGR